MSGGSSVILLALRPRFAELILSGKKTAELRRAPTRIEPESIALIYSSTPRRSIVGAVRVDAVHRLAPSTTWRRWGPATGLSKREFDEYVHGCGQVTAILVADSVAFSEPIPLTDLRERWQSFIAPQSYRYVGDAEFDAILNGQRDEVLTVASD